MRPLGGGYNASQVRPGHRGVTGVCLASPRMAAGRHWPHGATSAPQRRFSCSYICNFHLAHSHVRRWAKLHLARLIEAKPVRCSRQTLVDSSAPTTGKLYRHVS